jgi:hypothetical protein
MPDLACAIVHWNVPDLLAGCLASLLPQVEQLRAGGLAVEVLVVDSASRPEARERLRATTPPGVRVLWAEENLGYPRACNLAYDATDAPLVLLSNPDVVYLPGALEALLAAIADPAVALAGPATWWDRERTLLLNPGYPEDRERLEGDAAARRAGTWPEHALDWQRRMAAVAFATDTRAVDVIAGASILVRRRHLDAAGGLFDRALFLYYDDTDLCRRLRARGMPVLYAPRAEIVHLFNQSRRDDVAEHMAVSRRHFLARHYGAAEADRLLGLAREGVPAEEELAAWGVRDLGVLAGPCALAWEGAAGPSLFAMGLNPQIVPAAMAWRDRPRIGFTESFWSQLTPGPYWARATDADSRRVLAYWKFVVPP